MSTQHSSSSSEHREDNERDQKRNESSVRTSPSKPTPSSPPNNEDSVIRLRGLPYQVTESEIVEFLRSGGVTSVGTENVYILLSTSGRPSGEALAHIPSSEEIPQALTLHRKNLGSRYVEVFRSSQDELTKAMISARISVSTSDPKTVSATNNVVKMRGLPYNVTLAEIEDFFEGLQITVGGIHLMLGGDGRLNGEAFVEFTSEESAREALKKHRACIGRRYIELYRSSKGELINLLNQQESGAPKSNQQLLHLQQQRQKFPQQPGLLGPPAADQSFAFQPNQTGLLSGYTSPSTQLPYQQTGLNFPLDPTQAPDLATALATNPLYTGLLGNTTLPITGLTPNIDTAKLVKVRGLPYSATDADIRNFFSDCTIVPEGIHIVLNEQGKPSGKGFCEFETVADCQRAIQKHRQMMGSRYIEVYRSTVAELMSELYGPNFQQQLTTLTLLLQQQAQLAQFGVDLNALGLNFALTPQLAQLAQLALPAGLPALSTIPSVPSIPPSMPTIPSPLVPTSHQLSAGGGLLQAPVIPPTPYQYSYPISNKRPFDSSSPTPNPKRRPPTDADGQQLISPVTLRVKGLPPQCTELDVVTFFEGCRIVQNGVRFLTPANSLSMAEALVDFVGSSDAQKALQSHRNHFAGYVVEISQLHSEV